MMKTVIFNYVMLFLLVIAVIITFYSYKNMRDAQDENRKYREKLQQNEFIIEMTKVKIDSLNVIKNQLNSKINTLDSALVNINNKEKQIRGKYEKLNKTIQNSNSSSYVNSAIDSLLAEHSRLPIQR